LNEIFIFNDPLRSWPSGLARIGCLFGGLHKERGESFYLLGVASNSLSAFASEA